MRALCEDLKVPRGFPKFLMIFDTSFLSPYRKRRIISILVGELLEIALRKANALELPILITCVSVV